MRRWILYNRLTWLDILRLWRSVQHHIIIVAGICLPILLLLGLKNGHVTELRRALVESPTGRQISSTVGVEGEFLTEEILEEFRSIDSIDLVIPELRRALTLRSDQPGGAKVNTTLYTTEPGDPVLANFGVSLTSDTTDSDKGIVLARATADRLKVRAGDTVIATVRRSRDGVSESHDVKLTVIAIVESSKGKDDLIGFGSVDLLTAMERYVNGYSVPAFGWPAFKIRAQTAFTGFLIFCENFDKLTDVDISKLKARGFETILVEDQQLRTLYGLLKADVLENYTVYYANEEKSDVGDWAKATYQPRDLVAITSPRNDIAIPWNPAKEVLINAKPHRVVGLSLPRFSWLKDKFKTEDTWFSYSDDIFSVILLEPAADGVENVMVSVGSNQDLSFAAKYRPYETMNDTRDADGPVQKAADSVQTDKVSDSKDSETNSETNDVEDSDDELGEGRSPTVEDVGEPVGNAANSSQDDPPIEPSQNAGVDDTTSSLDMPKSVEPPKISADETAGLPTAVVPIGTLYYFHAVENDAVTYDSSINQFVDVPKEITYSGALVYANTIDDVPDVVEYLRQRNYGAQSKASQIEEIHKQNNSLLLLVVIVAIFVFIFGVITVVSVLQDSTERKRATIGILRVMGVSRFGIFYMIFLRAVIISVLAAAVTIAFGYGTALLLGWSPAEDSFWSWKPTINVLIYPRDLLMVVAGSLICCGLGSLIPARKASLMDPFDAIVEGRFR